jgi:hypothetical protein
MKSVPEKLKSRGSFFAYFARVSLEYKLLNIPKQNPLGPFIGF